MLTIESGGRAIKPGDDFVLYARAEDDWYEKAQLVQATDAKYRRGALPMEVVYTHDGFLSDAEKQIGFVGVHLNLNGQPKVLVPTDVMTLPKKGIEGSLKIGLVGAEDSRIAPSVVEQHVTAVDLPGISGWVAPNSFDTNDLRKPTQLESCLAIRAIGQLDELSYMHYPIELKDIKDDWAINNFSGARNVWHGAPVLSERDGRLCGVLFVESKRVWVERIPDL